MRLDIAYPRLACIITVLAYSVACGGSSLALRGSEPYEIPGSVSHVAWGRVLSDDVQDFRLVISAHCSPEHCFSRGQLQWLRGAVSDGASVREYVQIEELESVLIVNAIRWVRESEATPAHFLIEASNTYTGEAGTIAITPREPIRYEVRVGPALGGD